MQNALLQAWFIPKVLMSVCNFGAPAVLQPPSTFQELQSWSHAVLQTPSTFQDLLTELCLPAWLPASHGHTPKRAAALQVSAAVSCDVNTCVLSCRGLQARGAFPLANFYDANSTTVNVTVSGLVDTFGRTQPAVTASATYVHWCAFTTGRLSCKLQGRAAETMGSSSAVKDLLRTSCRLNTVHGVGHGCRCQCNSGSAFAAAPRSNLLTLQHPLLSSTPVLQASVHGVRRRHGLQRGLANLSSPVPSTLWTPPHPQAAHPRLMLQAGVHCIRRRRGLQWGLWRCHADNQRPAAAGLL